MSGNYLSKYGYVIRKENLEPETLVHMKKELTARPLTDTKFIAQNDSNFPVYIETKNKIYVPKMYGIEKFGLPKDTLDNYKGKSWETPYEFKGKLLEHQIEPVSNLIEACETKGGGILSLMTGGGKTFCGIYALSVLKGKAIIVVNKVTLLKQWESEINTFLPDARVGIIQGQRTIDVSDKDIVIAMLQSLSRIDYPDSLFSDFRVTLVDEIHNTSSKSFSKVFFKLCSQYTIGLSATPTRADGCEYVFKWHIGDIVYKSSSERKGKAPMIRLLKIDSDDYKEIATTNRFTGQKQIQFTSMLSELVEMETRNRLIVELIKQYNKESRKILVLSDRRTHLLKIHSLLEQDQGITFTYGLFLGGMKVIELERSKACNVILATVAAFGEGVSERDLDTLILTTPKKFIGHLTNNVTKNESGKLEQIIGRIFRKEHTTLEPLIVDLQDNFSVYKTQANGRNTFYKTHFKSAVLESQYVNLSDFTPETISSKSVVLKRTKRIEEPKEVKEENLITKFCIIE
jgi:superfamily II DNA or RNA helicase